MIGSAPLMLFAFLYRSLQTPDFLLDWPVLSASTCAVIRDGKHGYLVFVRFLTPSSENLWNFLSDKSVAFVMLL